MKRWLVSFGVLLASTSLSSAVVHADARGRERYSPWIADRPLTLPKWTAQVSGEVNILSLFDDDEQSLLAGFGFDIGLPYKLQVGAFGGLSILRGPLSEPYVEPRFAIFGVNLQVGLHRALNLRFDTGVVPLTRTAESGSYTHHHGFFGFGLPWRVALHRRVALQGWETSARTIGYRLFTDDLVTIAVWQGDHQTSLAGSFYVPIGLVVQPVQPLSLLVQVGYRLYFEGYPSGVNVTHYVPLRLGIAGHIRQYVDLGFTATLFGPLATADHWSDHRQFDFYVTGRF